MSNPLVTIVTPTYNMADYLPKAIESVLAQDYAPIEHIVVDGGSSDRTLDLLRNYEGKLRFVSEKDKGPSDAAHKGFLQGRGEVFAWLNADDVYLPGAIRIGAEYLAAHPDVDVVYGNGYWIDENGANISPYPTLDFDARVLERDCFICQPSAFIRASSYRKCGLDPDWNSSFDYDLWIRMAKLGFKFARIPEYLSGSRLHRTSMTINERDRIFKASMALLRRHYHYVPVSWVFGYTTYKHDGRDQFFEAMKPTVGNYVRSLGAGLEMNPDAKLRYLGEWLATPFRGALRRLAPR